MMLVWTGIEAVDCVSQAKGEIDHELRARVEQLLTQGVDAFGLSTKQS
jgi:hypothetical protein